jgi:hypothetical protein
LLYHGLGKAAYPWPRAPNAPVAGAHTQEGIMALERIQVSSAKAVTLDLKFNGIARYSAYLCSPAGGDEWEVSQVIEDDGHSADARADTFNLDALGGSEERLIFITSNMTSVATKGSVSLTARVLQDGNEIASRSASAEIAKGGYISLELRLVLRGS